MPRPTPIASKPWSSRAKAFAVMSVSSVPRSRTASRGGTIRQWFRTLKEQLLRVRHFATIEELRQALLAFKKTYNREWLIARLGYRPPAQARQAFALAPAASLTSTRCPTFVLRCNH